MMWARYVKVNKKRKKSLFDDMLDSTVIYNYCVCLICWYILLIKWKSTKDAVWFSSDAEFY